MKTKELDQILADHRTWIETGYKKGRRADLSGVDLSGVDLTGADLRETNLTGANLWDIIGNGREIKSMQIERYSVVYTSDILQIGCERHTVEEWRDFTDQEIDKMDSETLDWWKKWKEWIFNTIEMSPAIPTQTKER